VTLRIIDAKASQVVARVARTIPEQDKLHDGLREAVDELMQGMGGGGAIHVAWESIRQNPVFAVMDVLGQGVEPQVAASLTDVITLELSEFEGTRVYSRKDIETMLNLEAQEQLMGCDDTSCLAEIGGALGISYLVSATVSNLEGTYVLAIRMLDTTRAEVVGSEAERFRGPSDELLAGVGFVLRRMFMIDPTGTGWLRLTVAPDDSEVTFDGRPIGVSPDLTLPDALTPGKHTLTAQQGGYFPLVRETYVEAGRASTLNLTLLEMPLPWYKTWWFWTLAGTVLSATGIATAYLLNQPATTGEVGGDLPPLP
jgi:hypothetical protein